MDVRTRLCALCGATLDISVLECPYCHASRGPLRPEPVPPLTVYWRGVAMIVSFVLACFVFLIILSRGYALIAYPWWAALLALIVALAGAIRVIVAVVRFVVRDRRDEPSP
jgi:hypothetical protein